MTNFPIEANWFTQDYEEPQTRIAKFRQSLAKVLYPNIFDKSYRGIIPAYSYITGAVARPPPYSLEDSWDFSRHSHLMRMIRTRVRQEIMRSGWDIYSKFVKKCINPDCGKEFQTPVEECDECWEIAPDEENGIKGVRWVAQDPDSEQFKKADDLTDKPNPHDSFNTIIGSIIDWAIVLENWFITFNFRRMRLNLGENYDESFEIPSEIYVEDSRYFFPITDERGNLGNDEWFCPRCYGKGGFDEFYVSSEVLKSEIISDEKISKDIYVKRNDMLKKAEGKVRGLTFVGEGWQLAKAYNVSVNVPTCLKCSGELKRTSYIQLVNGRIYARYGKDEVIHGSTFRTRPEIWGEPRISSCWEILHIIDAMDHYNFENYTTGHYKRLVVVPGLDQGTIDRLLTKIEAEQKKATTPRITTGREEESKQLRVEFLGVKPKAGERFGNPVDIPLMPDPREMQSLEWYKFYVERICSLFGVSPVFANIIESGKCVFPRTKIWTSDGQKQASKIKVSDYVWTHEGRLRQVKEVISHTHRGDITNIWFDIWRGAREKNFEKPTLAGVQRNLTVTSEHQILTDKGWVQAKDLNQGDRVIVPASTCEYCGKEIPFWYKACCLEHHNRFLTQKFGLENGKRLLKTKEMSKPEKAMDSVIQVLALGKFKFTGNGKFWIENRCPDWVNENERKIIEYSGYYGAWDNSEKTEDRIKIFKDAGWDVLFIKGEITDAIVELCEKLPLFISHKCGDMKFTTIGVRYVKTKKIRPYKVYDFVVDEDRSFIARGIVVHNSGNNPRMQIDVQMHTIEDLQSSIEEAFNTFLFPRFGITDWEFRFEELQVKDEVRLLQVERERANVIAMYRNMGFDARPSDSGMEQLKDFGIEVGELIPQVPQGQPQAEGVQPLPKESEASGDLLEKLKLGDTRPIFRDRYVRSVEADFEVELDTLYRAIRIAKGSNEAPENIQGWAVEKARTIISTYINKVWLLGKKYGSEETSETVSELTEVDKKLISERADKAVEDFQKILSDMLKG